MANSTDAIACLEDIEKFGVKVLPKLALDFYESGSDQMATLRENVTAFNKYALN